jgi:hypothetical protein
MSQIAIYLASQIVAILCLPTPRGFGKVQHFVDDSQQAILLEQKGREIAKKYTAENGGSQEWFPAGLFQPA